MARSLDGIIPIRGPFGGLDDVAPPRSMDIRDCRDCNNVYTSDGGIVVRPPWLQLVSYTSYRGVNPPLRLLWAKQFVVRGPNATHNLLGALMQVSSTEARWFICDLDAQTVPAEGLGVFLGGSAGWPSQMVQVGNVLYANFDSPNATKWYYRDNAGTDVLRTERIGIAPYAFNAGPVLTLTPTFAGPIDIIYRASYYNQDTGAESPLSGPGPVSIPGGLTRGVDVLVDGSTDPQVTHIRVYRLIEGLDKFFYRAGEMPNAPGLQTFTDTNGGGKEFDDIGLLGMSPPPVGTALEWFRDRTFWGVRGKLYYSEFGQPELVNRFVNVFDVAPDDDIVRLIRALGGLLICLRRSLHLLVGSGDQSWALDRVAEVGVQSPHSVCVVGGDVYFANRDGAYRLTRYGPPETLTNGIRNAWLAFSSPAHMSVAHDRARGLLLFSAADASGERTMVYDVRFAERTGGAGLRQHRWWAWNRGSSAIRGVAAIQQANDRSLVLAMRSNGNLLQLGNAAGQDVGGAAIAWAWETPPTDLGGGTRKRHFFTRVVREVESGADTIQVQHGYDGAALGAATNHALTAGSSRDAGRRDFETMRVRISGNASGGVRISGIDLDVLPIGTGK